MLVRPSRGPVLATILLTAASSVPGVVHGQPKEEPKEPLPPGAVQRFGTSRYILRNGPTIAPIMPGCTEFLAPTMTGGVRRYEFATGKPLQKDGVVDAGRVLLSDDGKVAAVARTGNVTLVNVTTGAVQNVVPPVGVSIFGIPDISLSGDGKTLAYGGLNKRGKSVAVLWDVDRRTERTQIECVHMGGIQPVLSKDGKIVVTHPSPKPIVINFVRGKTPVPADELPADIDRAAQVWDDTGFEIFRAKVSGVGGRITSAAIAPDGEYVAVSAGDGPIDLWDVQTKERTQTLLGRKDQGALVAIAPDGKTIASMSLAFNVQRWRSDGTPLGFHEAPSELVRAPVGGLAFMDNEKIVGWATASQFSVAWEATTGKPLTPRMDHAAAIRSIAFPRDGKKILDPMTSDQVGRNFRWNLLTGAIGEEVRVRPAGAKTLRPIVSLTSDGRWALEAKPHMEVYDVATGEDRYCLPRPNGPTAPSMFHVFTDDNRVVAVSNQPGRTQTADKQPAGADMAGKEAGGKEAGGKEAGGKGGMCVVWDLDRQTRVAEVELPEATDAPAPLVNSSPDGNWIVTGMMKRNPPAKTVMRFFPIETKTGKVHPPVEDATATGTVKVALSNDRAVILVSSTGRIWSMNFAKGGVSDELDQLPVMAEPPITGSPAFSRDGKWFVVGVALVPFETYGVRVYDWPTRKLAHTFSGHRGPVTAIAFSPDGSALATGAQDTSVFLWDLSRP